MIPADTMALIRAKLASTYIRVLSGGGYCDLTAREFSGMVVDSVDRMVTDLGLTVADGGGGDDDVAGHPERLIAAALQREAAVMPPPPSVADGRRISVVTPDVLAADSMWSSADPVLLAIALCAELRAAGARVAFGLSTPSGSEGWDAWFGGVPEWTHRLSSDRNATATDAARAAVDGFQAIIEDDRDIFGLSSDALRLALARAHVIATGGTPAECSVCGTVWPVTGMVEPGSDPDGAADPSALICPVCLQEFRAHTDA